MGGGKVSLLREVNLEAGLPYVDQALKIIHGYGSSGTGGRIRTESRKYLARLKGQGTIRDFLPGEKFSIFEEDTRRAFARCDDLRRDRDLDRHNNGVTFILL